MKKAVLLGSILMLLAQFSFAQKVAKPVISSQNFADKTALWESIGNGVFNFQADVMYIYGKLYVTPLMPDSANHKLPTLTDAYLYPLYSQFKKNNGEIVPGYSSDVFLILNFAAQPIQIYKQLAAEMRPFSDMLTYKIDNNEHKGKLRILIKDKAQLDKINAIKPSFLGLVGSLADIDKNIDSFQMPLIEVDFNALTAWKGTGTIPFDDFVKIKELVAKVHAQKKKIVIANCPAYKTVADMIISSQADYMNTAEVGRVSAFFSQSK